MEKDYLQDIEQEFVKREFEEVTNGKRYVAIRTNYIDVFTQIAETETLLVQALLVPSEFSLLDSSINSNDDKESLEDMSSYAVTLVDMRLEDYLEIQQREVENAINERRTLIDKKVLLEVEEVGTLKGVLGNEASQTVYQIVKGQSYVNCKMILEKFPL